MQAVRRGAGADAAAACGPATGGAKAKLVGAPGAEATTAGAARQRRAHILGKDGAPGPGRQAKRRVGMGCATPGADPAAARERTAAAVAVGPLEPERIGPHAPVGLVARGLHSSCSARSPSSGAPARFRRAAWVLGARQTVVDSGIVFRPAHRTIQPAWLGPQTVVGSKAGTAPVSSLEEPWVICARRCGTLLAPPRINLRSALPGKRPLEAGVAPRQRRARAAPSALPPRRRPDALRRTQPVRDN